MIHGRLYRRGFSTIRITATLCIVGLVGVIAWQIDAAFQSKNAPIASAVVPPANSEPAVPSVDWQKSPGISAATSSSTDPDGLSNIGQNVVSTLTNSYTALSGAGEYSPAVGAQIATDVASTLQANVSYQKFSPTDIKTDADISLARMLAYRADMRVATAPLLKNKEAEYIIFARYLDTHDASNLVALKKVAQNYRNAITLGAKVVVPADAVQYHVAILNSLSEFAATLDAMSNFADDPFASAALLRTYDTAERDVLVSFNAAATYYKQKVS